MLFAYYKKVGLQKVRGGGIEYGGAKESLA